MFYSTKKTTMRRKKEVRVVFKDSPSCSCNCQNQHHLAGEEDAEEPPRVPPMLPPPRPPSPIQSNTQQEAVTSKPQSHEFGFLRLRQMWAKRIDEFRNEREHEKQRQREEFVARVKAGKGAILFPMTSSSKIMTVKYGETDNSGGEADRNSPVSSSSTGGDGEDEDPEEDSHSEEEDDPNQQTGIEPRPPSPRLSHLELDPPPGYSSGCFGRRWECWSPVRRRRIHYVKKINSITATFKDEDELLEK